MRYIDRNGRAQKADRSASLREAGENWDRVWPKYVEYLIKCDEEKIQKEAEEKAENVPAIHARPHWPRGG